MDMEDAKKIIDKIKDGTVSNGELKYVLTNGEIDGELFKAADGIRRKTYGDRVFIRGLIELTNYCRNNCFYCGIRRGNEKAERYRLSKDMILECCRSGFELGFRTFVLQGGEDGYFTDGVLTGIVASIKERFPECAVTLSMGERSKVSFERLYSAGADRYLLRHEAVNEKLYSKLHPKEMSLKNRLKCLKELKDIGFQTGTGFMTGAPNQTIDNIIEEIRFIKNFEPQMIGIGPYIAHPDTPFKNYKNGALMLAVRLISIFRLMLPDSLIPSTTALATIDPEGRIMGLKAGANVVMPNLSPDFAKEKYTLYEGKAISGAESAFGLDALKESVLKAGYKIVTDRGDYRKNAVL